MAPAWGRKSVLAKHLESRSEQWKSGGSVIYLLLELFRLQLSFFTESPLRCFLDTLSHCKQRSSTVSQKARTVSKKAQIVSKKAPKHNCKQKSSAGSRELSTSKKAASATTKIWLYLGETVLANRFSWEAPIGIIERGVPQAYVRARASSETLRSVHVLRVFLCIFYIKMGIWYVSKRAWRHIWYVSKPVPPCNGTPLMIILSPDSDLWSVGLPCFVWLWP